MKNKCPSSSKIACFVLAVGCLVIVKDFFEWQSIRVAEPKSPPSLSAGDSTKQEKTFAMPPTVILTAIERHSLHKLIPQIPDILPKPRHIDTVEIYNKQAWQDLFHIFTTQKNFSLCANGGSSTAGAGLRTEFGHFYYQFVNNLAHTKVTLPNVNVSIIPRGHGGRSSLHSAMFSKSYIPPHTDIILWEFAINDFGYDARNETKRTVEEKNEMILWLDQVSKLQPRPPLVLLAHLWKSPLATVPKNGKIDNPVFLSHAKVAAEYDFVVGHVNLASYIDNELEWDISHARKVLLKDGDVHHPDEFGHAVLAHLLLDLVVDKERAENIATIGATARKSPVGKTPFRWACGTENQNKRFVQSRVQSKDASSRTNIHSPQASFTYELPRNEEIYPGMLVHVPNYATPIKITRGKYNPPVRIDRQDSVVMPCCHSNQTIHFNVPSHQTKPLERIQALQLRMDKCLTTKIQIFLDGELVPNRIIAPTGWDCTWKRDQYPGVRWLALEQEWDASSIQFCIAQDKCCREEGSTGSCSKFLSLVVY